MNQTNIVVSQKGTECKGIIKEILLQRVKQPAFCQGEMWCILSVTIISNCLPEGTASTESYKVAEESNTTRKSGSWTYNYYTSLLFQKWF